MVMWMDLGFTGFKKDYPDTLVIMPKKKPKGKELSDDAKAWNRIVSGFRVLVEHAIGGIKRFGIVSDKFRNKSSILELVIKHFYPSYNSKYECRKICKPFCCYATPCRTACHRRLS